MKKFLLIFLCFSLFFIGGGLTHPNKYEDMSFSDADITVIFQKGFILSEGFIKADDETMLSLLAESQGMIKNLSAKEKSEYLIEYKKTAEVYIKENSNNDENIIDESVSIIKSPYTHSFISSNQSQNFLDIITQQMESKPDHYLANDIEFKLVRSGLGKYRDRFEYIFMNTKFNFNGNQWFSNHYFISVNNQGYHIVINTIEGQGIYDIFTEIN